MDYIRLPTAKDPWQVMYLSVSPDGNSFTAKVDLRYLKAPGKWFLSIVDATTGELYVNMIPVICSYIVLNDLLEPFRYLFGGSGIGSFFCLRNTDHPSSADPGKNNLDEFQLYWGDRYES